VAAPAPHKASHSERLLEPVVRIGLRVLFNVIIRVAITVTFLEWVSEDGCGARDVVDVETKMSAEQPARASVSARV